MQTINEKRESNMYPHIKGASREIKGMSPNVAVSRKREIDTTRNDFPVFSRGYEVNHTSDMSVNHEIAGGDYSGRFYSTTACEGVASFQVTKRATPIISKYGNPILHEQAIGAKTFSAVSAGVLGSTFAFYECTGTSSATAGNICWGRNAHLIVDAEI